MKQISPYGKYVLLERISVGGMAEVFKARLADDLEQGKTIAIKRILPSMAEDADFIQMFIDEARIAGQLHQPHIAEIFELGTVGESHFIAMEYVWGKDLLQLQNRFRRLKQTMPIAMAAFSAMKVAEALDYAHRKNGADGNPLGIIHRDVSPQNVLVSYEGEIKVIDFGIAKAASRSTKTQAGVLKGKFGYMSPEQVGGRPLDRRSDVFAIGTILYELLTADRLFIGESDFATLEKVRNVDVAPPRQVVPACPEELERIILKALARDVEERYLWASELRDDLAAFLTTLPQPFAAAEYSSWMCEQFAVEKRREEAALIEQLRSAAKLGAAVSPAEPVAVGADTPTPSVVIPAPSRDRAPAQTIALGLAGVLDQGEQPDLMAEPTQITTASVSQIVADVIAANARRAALSSGGQGSPSDQVADRSSAGSPPATEGAADSDASTDLLVESTRIISSDDQGAMAMGDATDMPQRATVLLDTSTMQWPPMPTPASVPRVPAPVYVAPPQLPRVRSQLDANPPTSEVDALPYLRARRRMLIKDIAIGLGVAAVVVAGGLTLRSSMKPVRQVGTLVVTVLPTGAATVDVDGDLRGRIESGRALTLRDVAAGSHRVHVHGEAGDFDEVVEIPQNDVAVVSALLVGAPVAVVAPPKAQIAPPAGAQPATPDGGALVAGATIARPAATAPATPTAPVRAVVAPIPTTTTTTTPVAEPSGSTTNPKPSAAQTGQAPGPRTAAASKDAKPAGTVPQPAATRPLGGHLSVTTDPAGAEVSVNGAPAGLSPVDVTDVQGTTVKLLVHKKGYVTIARKLDFEREPNQTLDLKLVSASGSDANAAPAAPTKGASKAIGDAGFLVANTQPWAKVIIDGKDTGQSTPIAPHSRIALKPGTHVVTFVVDGKKFSFDVEIEAGKETKLIKTLGD